jgi:phosphoadenosine phosphosulfate reductase
MKTEDGEKLAVTSKDMSAEDVLRYFVRLFSAHTESGPGDNEKDRIALASSLGAEDQVLTHMILSIKPDARIFVLDTGRFHAETYDLMAATMKKYDMLYEIVFPDSADVEVMERECGSKFFYDSVENRKRCCTVRKVRPLKRVLSTLDAWITGLRRERAVAGTSVEKVEWDRANGLVKVNPLVDWSEKDLWDYINRHDVPYNKLHDHGYPSIGCVPCTGAILVGEDLRAGRWWWETPEQKECGLHVVYKQQK